MKFSEQWLREWVNPPIDTKKLCEQLTLAGIEVKQTTQIKSTYDKIVTGKITEALPHPKSDALSVCQVNIGKQTLTIVCGAENAKRDLVTAVALVGSTIEEKVIEQRSVQGTISQGMLCAASELGISESSKGIWELPPTTPVGEKLSSLLPSSDTIIEVDITPNRADCFSIIGIARELAAINKIPLKQPFSVNHYECSDEKVAHIENTEHCSLYSCQRTTNINTETKTPIEMQYRLMVAGIQPNCPVVDVTNYVLLELGQPLHAFDTEKLQGKLHVRQAKGDEKVTLLNSQLVELTSKTLLITDDKKTLAIAGIMGAQNSEISPNTNSILLESAHFTPLTITGKAREYGLHTESSKRFERGVDPELPLKALSRASDLIHKITNGKAHPQHVTQANKNKTEALDINYNRVNERIGVQISKQQMSNYLTALCFDTTETKEGWKLTPPSWRFDIKYEVDIVEEVARIHGYNNIEPQKPSLPFPNIKPTPEKIRLNHIKTTLSSRGYQEVITYSFIDPSLHKALELTDMPITLSNPISQDMSSMRTSLWPGLIQSLIYNQNRQQERMRYYESGLCFIQGTNSKKPVQKAMIAGLVSGKNMRENWCNESRALDFYDIKSDITSLIPNNLKQQLTFKKNTHPALHPGQTAKIYLSNEPIGFVGQLHPNHQQKLNINNPVFLFEISQSSLLHTILPKYTKPSKFPSIRRDISLLANKDVAFDKIKESVKAVGGSQITDLTIFDVYSGKQVKEEEKSIGVAVTFSSEERTLTDEEINISINNIIKKLKEEHKIKLRT